MVSLQSYTEYSFLNFWKEEVCVKLEAILNSFKKCTRYKISSVVSNYLTYIDEDIFYVAPSFNAVKIDNKISTLKPRFILFSAPGATGKSCLAKYIAHEYNAIYWDSSKLKLGENSFDGSLLKMVGPAEYSHFTNDLKEGKAALVIDAFDEAEAVSGRTAIQNFIEDLNHCIDGSTTPCVFLFSRTETAQFIVSLCVENNISLQHYEIGFFEETQAISFIGGQLQQLKKIDATHQDGLEKGITPAETDCIEKYYYAIQNNISANEKASFLGYAPVLQAIAAEIKGTNNTAILINKLTGKCNCTDIILQIMRALLSREKDKVVNAFSERCKSEHPEFSGWDKVYSDEEQLTRLVSYVLFEDTKYSNYKIDELPPQLIDDYQSIINSFLPQHPFIQNYAKGTTTQSAGVQFTGPAFRDYTLAELILKSDGSALAQMYFEDAKSRNFSPSPIFSDCYLNICQNRVHSDHISYVYESFRSKSQALERAYLQYTEQIGETGGVSGGSVTLGRITAKKAPQHPALELNMIMDTPENPELCFERMYNISLDAPNVTLRIGRSGSDASIHNSLIICKRLVWNTEHLLIESKQPTGCLIYTKENSVGTPPTIEIVCADELKIFMPDINLYYKLYQYGCDFENPNDIDIIKFTHALRCILIEFRTHSKDVPAKHIERIDNVVVGNNPIKKKVLTFMKETGILYEDAHLYKVDLGKMQECGISYIGLSKMNFEQLQIGYEKFKDWDSDLH